MFRLRHYHRLFRSLATLLLLLPYTSASTPEGTDLQTAPDPTPQAHIHQTAETLAVGIQSMNLRAAQAYRLSRIAPNRFKGMVGESLGQKIMLEKVLDNEAGTWQPISSRTIPQGIDEIFVRYNSQNYPNQLMVVESKYGTSRLGNTLSGIQMGPQWIRNNLMTTRVPYEEISVAETIEYGVKPLNAASIPMRLPNGEDITCWKDPLTNQWKYEGAKSEARSIRMRAQTLANLIQGSAEERIAMRKRISLIEPDGNDLKVRLYDAESVGNPDTYTNPKKYKLLDEYTIQGAYGERGKMPKETVEEVARLYQKWFLCSDSEARAMAQVDLHQCSMKQICEPTPIWKHLGMHVAFGTAVVTAMDIAGQYFEMGTIDYGRTGVMAGAASLGVLGAYATERFLQSSSLRLAKNGVIRKVIPGGAAVAIFICGDYVLAYRGKQSWEQANISALGQITGFGLAAVTGKLASPLLTCGPWGVTAYLVLVTTAAIAGPLGVNKLYNLYLQHRQYKHAKMLLEHYEHYSMADWMRIVPVH